MKNILVIFFHTDEIGALALQKSIKMILSSQSLGHNDKLESTMVDLNKNSIEDVMEMQADLIVIFNPFSDKQMAQLCKSMAEKYQDSTIVFVDSEPMLSDFTFLNNILFSCDVGNIESIKNQLVQLIAKKFAKSTSS